MTLAGLLKWAGLTAGGAMAWTAGLIVYNSRRGTANRRPRLGVFDLATRGRWASPKRLMNVGSLRRGSSGSMRSNLLKSMFLLWALCSIT